MSQVNAEINQSNNIKRSLTFRVFGIGRGGGNAIRQMSREEFAGVTFHGMNTEAQALAELDPAERILLGSRLTRGLGAGGDPELGRAAAEEDAATLKKLCEGADIVFIMAGLGGGTGTGASPVLARLAKEAGALVLAVVTLPFDCEGGRRQRQAMAGLQQLKQEADAVICLPNQKMLKLIDEHTSLRETFSITNDYLAEGVRGIWRLLTRPGLINIDFADVCTITRGRHAQSSLATVRASGENRVRELVEKVMSHPLLDGGQALTDAEALLISLAGGPDLTISEINKVMEQVNRQCENAQLIMGAAVQDDLVGKLEVTIVASSGLVGRQEAAPSAPSRNVKMEASPLEFSQQFLNTEVTTRPASRFVAPPPELPQEKTEDLFSKQSAQAARQRKKAARQQQELKLEIVSKGRFEKSEPTIRHGEDLDVPTYIRRGVPLN